MDTRRLSRAALLAAVLAAGTASADERLEARRHFRIGMSLVAEKQFDQGIAELEAAYEILPHPNVLFNIAQAQREAGRDEAALASYRRYLSFAPKDSGQVQAAVAELEARIRARSEASRRTAEPLPMPPPPTTRGGVAAQPMLDPGQKQALEALLKRLETAVAKAEAVGTAPAAPSDGAGGEAASAPAPGKAATAAVASAAGAAEGGEFAPYEERVVSAGRRAQSTFEAPYATTVITAEDIRLSGATTLQEVLRRVPGAEVMAMGVGNANVSFRGFNQRLSNKVLVLVDGRSEYQDFLGLTIWSAMPVSLQEIERVEVIRGPGSALYGANAMLGVVNIITRAPGTGKAGDLTAMLGAGNSAAGTFVGSGGNDKLRYRASVGYEQADKWSRDFEEGRSDYASMVGNPLLGQQSARGNLNAIYTPVQGLEVGVSGGVNRFYTELYPVGVLRNYFADGVTAYAKTDFTAGPVKLKMFWNHLGVDAGPQYAPPTARSMRTRAESNVFDGELSYGQAFELLGKHQLNFGVNGRIKRLGWGYMAGLQQEAHYAAFAEDEWRVVDQLRVVSSLRADSHPLLNRGQRGLAYSPRVSVLWLPLQGHGFRVSGASSFRAPTMLESYVDLAVPVPGTPGASGLTQGNRSLAPERLTAFELGYRGEAQRLGLDWDVALYQHRVKDLIGLSAFAPLPAGQAYQDASDTYLLGRANFYNEPGIYWARGVELGASASPVDGLGIKLSGALQNVSAEGLPAGQVCAPCVAAPLAKLYGSVTYRTPSRVSFGVEGSYTGSTVWVEREPDKADPTSTLFTSNALPGYAVFHARIGFEPIADRLAFELRGTHLGQAHQEHPFGNLLDRRVFLSVRITP
jgi:iron complex outermembrane receptor protein